ncbi:hypothetical protein PV325_013443 [Microctonus aethiopoides]|nr:hypothetical protein PV325_013443 [Microctonus aethiopoides]
MSVISSRTTSIASILKCPGTRAKLVGTQNRVNFKLPKNLKNLLTNYETGSERKVYDDLICILKNANIKDDELIELLVEVRQSISLLGPTHKIFIEALLSINWMNRCHEATTAYKEFLEDLVCVHIYHCKLVLDKLVSQFKPSSDDAEEWKNNEPRKEEIQPLDHIHDVIHKFLMIVPMSCTLLLQSLSARYPYFKTSTHSHEIYFYSLLRILDYAPQLRSEILSLIINRLIILDVNAPRSEIESHRENEMDDDEDDAVFHIDSVNETDDKTKEINNSPEHPLAHSLDVCMEMLFGYIYNVCHPDNKLDMEAVRKLYFELLPVFESVILPTYASHHVQFIIFYICSFKITVLEAFLNWLWLKVSNPNVAPVIRQSAVAYIASLVARANFIPIK